MQQTESYEALNNTTFYFISCPNWGQDTNNYGTGNTCPHTAGTNDNGTLQSYREYLGNSTNATALTWFNDTYTYDGLNRLNTATDKDPNGNLIWARTYNYDQWGNMWQPGPYNNPWSATSPTTNVYNQNNTNNNQASGQSYDLAGNLLNVNGLTAKYNAENQISTLNSTLSGGAETISYDATGQRVQKAIASGPSTVYFYGAFGQLASESVNGTWTRDYIRDGSGNLVATENAPGGLCTTCYPSYDHLGSVRLVTDQNGNVAARHDYLPYGQEVSGYSGRTMAGFTLPNSSPTASTDVTPRFTGQVQDQESGLAYFNARYLTPALGRFNSPDPQNAGASLLSSQSWNGYGYALGNPMVNTDPTGLYNDCGGPCVPFSFNNDEGCVVTVTYEPQYSNGGLYDIPIFTVNCKGQQNQGTPSGPPGGQQGGGGGGTSTANAPQPHKNDACVSPSFAQRAIVYGLSFLSKRTGLTLGYGTGGSIGAGRKPIAVNYAISMQFVAAPDGTVGKQFSYTPNSASYFSAGTTGYGGLFGLQFSSSNARTISDLEGGGVDAGGLIADGLGVGGDLSVGSSGGRLITQSTLTAGFGFGGKGAAGVLTQTVIKPFCP